jgi:alcohol dehydrogenase
MKAAVFDQFQTTLQIREVADPQPHPDSAIIAVKACGICRSDWHGWMGHDSDVSLPHVPGHELAGRVTAVGEQVRGWTVGQRITAPFCCGCDHCEQCASGNPQICDNHTQPGFTQWGAFAEFVEIRFADVNLVGLPDELDFVTAASLGCRFATSFRAIVAQGRVSAGDWVAIHGCGGVGLSAVMIASAVGANVIAIDIQPERLRVAERCGASFLLGPDESDVPNAVKSLTSGGAHVSVDAFGSHATCWNSVSCLRKRGRHIQIGLTLGEQSNPRIPMDIVVARELEVLGSHGLQAFEYGRMFRMIQSGAVNPRLLITDCVSLESGAELLPKLNQFPGNGVTVIDRI